jgi:methionine-rich copper-binding protein CopC
MATYTGTAANDSWTVVNPGTFSLDGLGGTDTLYLGTSLRSSYTITKSADGAVHVDSISGASGALHATLYNMEVLVFNSKRDTLDLTTYFGGADTTPPTVSITDNVAGTTNGNVTYALAFSENVTGLAANDFTVANGSVVSVSGSGASYSVVVAPNLNTQGSISLTLNAGAVTDAAGNPNVAANAAAQAIDTLAPTVTGISPAAQATGVAVGANIVVNFSEAIQRGTGVITLKDGAGATVASYDAATSGNLSVSGSALTINPTADLAAGAVYSVVLAAGAVKDSLGNALATGGSTTFTTAVDPANPKLSGTSGNDVFNAGSTTISFDGLAGIDTVNFAKAHSAYTVTPTATGFTVSDGTAVDNLANIERLHFTDTSLALDLSGHAGDTAKILGAVFGSSSLQNPQYVGIGLSLLDGGTSYESLMQLALNVRLGANASHAAVVDLLYTNVVGSAPPAGDEAYYVGLLDSGALTPAALAVLAANTDMNQSHIDLVGLAHTGIAFVS